MDILITWCSYKRETWSPMITNFVADNNYKKTCLCSTKKSVTKLAPLFVYRFSVPTASVPSAWPSFSPLTCHKKWPPGILNIWNRQNKNPAPRGTRENKEENNIIILHSNDSFIPLTYLTYTLCTTKFSALFSTKLSAFISEIMYLLYICR